MADDNRTEYVVLRAIADNGWREVTRVTAHSAMHARKQAAAQHLDAGELDQGVDLRAIPARNWDAGAGHMKAKHETRIVTT